MRSSLLFTLTACLMFHGSRAQLQQGCIRLDAGFTAVGLGDAVQLTDGGYATAGFYAASNNGHSDMSVARFDANGALLWMKVWSTSAALNTWARTIVATDDGGMAVAGTLESTIVQGLFIMKLDAAGAEQWTRTYMPSSGVAALQTNGFAQLADGGFALQAEDLNNDGWCMLRTDAAGTMIWNDKFDPADAHATGVAELPNGDLVFVGWDNSFDDNGVVLRKDGLTGVNEWIHTYGSDPSFKFYPYGVVVGPDSTIVVGGNCGPYVGPNNVEAYAMALSADGTPQWLEVVASDEHDICEEIALDPSGGYVLAGHVVQIAAPVDLGAFVAKLNGNGQLAWAKRFDHPDITARFLHASATADGGFLFSGYSGDSNGYPALLVKLDADGESCPYCPTSDVGQGTTLTPLILPDGTTQSFGPWATQADHTFIVTDITANASYEVCGTTGVEEAHLAPIVTLSPNPFTMSCILTIEHAELNHHAQVIIRDMSGRTVHEQGVRVGDNVIDRGALAPGCYTYAITGANTFVNGGKFQVID